MNKPFVFKKPHSSRTADKFVLRLPDGMRDTITDLAAANHLSMNAYLVQCLEKVINEAPDTAWTPTVGMLVATKDDPTNLMTIREFMLVNGVWAAKCTGPYYNTPEYHPLTALRPYIAT